MTDQLAVHAVQVFVLLIAVTSVVALASRRAGVPDDLMLLLVGLAAAIALPGTVEVDPQIVLLILLPGLVFEAAYRIPFVDLRRSLWAVSLLAVPGVVVTAVVVALVLVATTGMPLALAFVVGAMVSPTDPAAMIAAFTRLRAPRGLATIVESESLMNDGTGIVLFGVALAFAAGGSSIGEAAARIVLVVAGSILIGIATGFAASRLVAAIDDFVVEIALTITVAYGSYLAADALGLSGIIATVVAGIALGNYGREIGMSERTRGAVDVFWGVIGFVMTAIVFLLIGVTIRLPELPAAAAAILWGGLAAVLARAVVVYGLIALTGRALHWTRRGRGLPPGWSHVIFWSGLRGAVAVALALSLPTDLPMRVELQEIVFGIVLLTILVQGTTAPFVLRRTVPARAEAAEAPPP